MTWIATVLPDAVIEALATIHDRIGHDMATEEALFFVQAEITKSIMVTRSQDSLLQKQERTILDQAQRIQTQHQQIKQMELDAARIQMQMVVMQGELAYERGRTVMSRLLGKLYGYRQAQSVRALDARRDAARAPSVRIPPRGD